MSYSPSEKHILVNYHYVEDPRKGFSGINPTPIKTFEEQMEFLSKNYRFGSVPEVFDAAQDASNERLCAITFDDGLRDQRENAVPILEKYNATATFFIITGTLDGIIPSAHIIHLLLSKASAGELVESCNIFFQKEFQDNPELVIPKDRRITTTRKMRDDVLTANFKETIYRLPKETEEKCLAYLLQSFRVDREEASTVFFMNEDMIKNLSQKGHWVECHGHNHYALDVQDEEIVRDDVRTSKRKLEKITGNPVTALSYPHGGYSVDVQEIIEEEGFSYGVTIERRGVHKNDSPYAIPRYDTKDIVIE